MKTENFTYGVVGEANAKGIIVRKVYPLDSIEADIKAATESGNEPPELLDSQSFTGYEIESDADFHELVPDEKERVNLANRGLTLKLQNKARQLLGQAKAVGSGSGFFEYSSVEGFYDLREAAGELTVRQSASPMDKALKAVQGLSAEDFAALAKMIQERAAAA